MVKDISSITGYCEKTIRTALINNRIYEQERKKRGYASISKVIAMLDYNTKEILQVFPSIEAAYRFLNKQSSGHIA